MNIALDFDNTYTKDPILWNIFIQDAIVRGHFVYCVTKRSFENSMDVYTSIGPRIGESRCHFTSMQSKKKYMDDRGIKIDVWIDDMPDKIV